MKQITTLHPENNQDIDLYPNISPEENIPDKSIGSNKLKDELIAMITGATQEQVDHWLDEHPEATTSVEDGSLTEIKFAQSVINDFKNSVKIGNVKFYGAVGDGVTNDTTSIINCIANNDFIYFPKGKYLINQRISLNKKILFGDFSTPYNDQSIDNGIYFTGSGSFNTGSCILSNLKFIGDRSIGNTAIDGSGSSVLENCDFYNFDNAIYNINTTLINKCKIHDNNYGVNVVVDSRIIDNFFNVNYYAINLSQGSNDNIISNNKIEWNNVGIISYNNSANIISNNIFDRQTTYALRLNGFTKSVISSNMFRRNYVANDTSSTHSQLFFENCSYLSILGNVTRTGGSMDDGTGFECPPSPAYMQTSNNIISVGNDWSGGVVLQNISLYNNSSIKFYDLQNNQVLRYLGYVNSNEITIAPSSSNTYTFNVNTSANIIYFYKLMITARPSSNSTFSYKECNVSTHLRWGTTQAVSIDENSINSQLGLSVSIADNIVTLTITNNDTSEWRVRISNVTLNTLNY